MTKPILQHLRDFGVWMFRVLGSEILDCRTGEPLGRGMVISWGGRIHLLGLSGAVVPVPLHQARITYWRQEVGFTRHPVPDFPRAEPAISLLGQAADCPDRVLLVLMDHRAPDAVGHCVGRWLAHGFAEGEVLLVFGGSEADFEGIRHGPKVLLRGNRHRTRDHTREKQSYRELFTLVARHLEDHPAFSHVLFVEYDQVPVCPLVGASYLERMNALDADLLGCQLARIDGSTNPHFLALGLGSASATQLVLSMLGTGHFWKRAAWLASAADQTFADWYLELDIPTTALRLGFRICGLPDQDRFVTNLPEKLPCGLDEAEALGAWTLHPVKNPRV